MEKITLEMINDLSYTQFISLVNQWNVPPGSISTISEWSVFSRVNDNSRVLEIACTTGFSGRELARLTNCEVVGIDICKDSVERAKFNHQTYFPHLNLTYHHIDAYEFEPEQKFTHIILGAALGFFPDKEKAIKKCISMLEDDGYLLVSPYYNTDQELPQWIIEDCQRTIGIYPTNFDYYTAIEPYQDLEVVYENRKSIVIENEEQMKKYSTDIINRTCQMYEIDDEEIITAMYERMYEIKKVCNDLHAHHSYSIMVLRYNKAIYPNRFIELF